LAATDPEQAKKANAIITNALRIEGAVLMAAGPVLGFNVMGAAEAIGLHGDLGGIPFCQVMGAMAFVMGLWSYFVIPVILRRARERAEKNSTPSSM
jgi:hypothetical protein